MGRRGKGVELSSDEDDDYNFADAVDDEDLGMLAASGSARKPTGKRARGSAGSDSDLSGGSSSGGGSGGASDSSSSSDRPFTFMYDSEGFGDAADRAKLDAMNEADREELIYERVEKRRQALSLFDMNRRLRREERERRRGSRGRTSRGGKSKKKKARRGDGGAGGGDGDWAAETSTGRKKPTSKAEQRASALQDLKMRKAGVARGPRRGLDRDGSYESDEAGSDFSEDERRRGRRGGRGRYSDEDYDDALEDLDLEEIEKRREQERADAEDATLDELRKIFLSRNRLAMWCNEPFFDETVVDFLVRVSIGQDPEGKQRYKVARVSGVRHTSEEPVNPADPDGPTRPKKYDVVPGTRTDKVLELRAENGSVRTFRMIFVSSSPPQDAELLAWLAGTRQHGGGRVPTKGHVKSLLAKKNAAINFRYTDAVVREVLEKRRKDGTGPVNLSAELHACEEKCDSLRATLRRLRASLEESEDPAQTESHIDAVTAELEGEEKRLATLREKERVRSEELAEHARDHFTVFMRNKQLNEKRMMMSRAADENRRVLELTTKDPSQRRLCQPKVLWATQAERKQARERKAREEAEKAAREEAEGGDDSQGEDGSGGDRADSNDPASLLRKVIGNTTLFESGAGAGAAAAVADEKGGWKLGPVRAVEYDLTIDISGARDAQPRPPKTRLCGSAIRAGRAAAQSNSISLEEYMRRAAE